MTYLSLSEARAVETPAATMRTYASPSSSTPAPVAVWRSELPAGTSGPLHTVDVDHIVVVVEGTLVAEVDGVRHEVVTGDGIKLPAGSVRRLTGGDGTAVTVTAALPGSTARVGGGDPVPVPWAS